MLTNTIICQPIYFTWIISLHCFHQLYIVTTVINPFSKFKKLFQKSYNCPRLQTLHILELDSKPRHSVHKVFSLTPDAI